MDNTQDDNYSKVLIIYTGGTIGMKPTEEGLVPAKNYLQKQLSKLHQFHDKNYPSLTTPVSRFGKRIHYEVLEWEHLMDSSNMDISHWIHMVNDIEDNYDKYDAFIILHGTDTMAYTASALSFMIENLKKSVILTGSQVPIANDPNDAGQNLLGALTIAGHFVIPEVCIFFGNKLLRGNRSTKVDSLGFNAYESPNFRELVSIGTEINVNWDIILQPDIYKPTKFHRSFNMNVGVLKLFPGIHHSLVQNFLKPPLEGCIIETYGTGNAPNTSKEFLDAIEEATNRGVIIINVTQCLKGFVRSDTYATGSSLSKRGVISGKDITTEGALTKLSFLLGLNISRSEVMMLIGKNLRGEITDPKKKVIYSFNELSFVDHVARHLRKSYTDDENSLHYKYMLYPFLMCSASTQNNVYFVNELIKNGADVNVKDYEGKTPLHIAAKMNYPELAQILIENGAKLDSVDEKGLTPLDYAKEYNNENIIKLLTSS